MTKFSLHTLKFVRNLDENKPQRGLASKCDVGNWIFSKSWDFFEKLLGFLARNFLGGIFLEEFFWRNSLGGFFCEDFFGRNSLFTLHC